MALIFDAVFLLIVLLFVLRGIRAGIISSLVGLLAVALAYGISVALSDSAAVWIYNTFVESRLVELVEEKLPSDLIQALNNGIVTGSSALDRVRDYFTADNGLLSSLLKDFEIPSLEAGSSYIGKTAHEIAVDITAGVLQPIVIKFIRIIATVVIFAVVYFLLNILRRALRARRAPRTLSGKINKILGGVFGLVEGGILGLVYAKLLYFFSTALGGRVSWLNSAILADTRILKLIVK